MDCPSISDAQDLPHGRKKITYADGSSLEIPPGFQAECDINSGKWKLAPIPPDSRAPMADTTKAD